MSQLSFTRVMIEVDLSADLLRFINISLPDGTTLKQRVLYEFLPKFCTHCCMPGHTISACKNTSNDTQDPPNLGKVKKTHVSPSAPSEEVAAVGATPANPPGESPPSSNADVVVAGGRDTARRGKKAKNSSHGCTVRPRYFAPQ